MAAKPGLDLNRVLKAINTRDMDFYNNLAPEEKKSFSSWMMMRWASLSTDQQEHYAFMVNELVNKHYTITYPHPELQWLLLCACGSGTNTNRRWIKGPGKPARNKVEEWLLTIYPQFNSDELTLFMTVNSIDDLKQLARDNGITDKEIKDLWK